MRRVVLDTNILVSALRSKQGPSRVLLRRLAAGEFTALVSVPLFLEYESVLKRPEQLLATGLVIPERVDRFLGDFLRYAEPVRVSYL
jgi:predicted nucleic acid-binding protein